MVQIYAVNVSTINKQEYETLYSHASPNRQIRASACRSRENAACCLVSEALLRYAVKQRMGISQFTIETNPYGKPSLSGYPDFYFNISHSGNWVVLACGSTQVGIDVETLKMDTKRIRVARRFYTEMEQNFVFRSEDGQMERFLEIWTAKESYLKFLGTGLQKHLNSFDVCTMTEPRLYTCWLGETCMTLCTTEEAYQLTEIKGESLCVMQTVD